MGLIDYYSRRANEYERIYEKPERQKAIANLKSILQQLLPGHDILEVACGTGYWTQIISAVARSVVATDMSPEVLEIARSKSYPHGRVCFTIADAYDLDPVSGHFTAGLAAFWWSHLPKQDISRFLAGFHRRLGPGAKVVFTDNRYVEGNSSSISYRDEMGNTYQDRRLVDGSEFRVLKNFPTEAELRAVLQDEAARVITTSTNEYFWCLSYEVGANA